MVVCGIEPFKVALNMAPATSVTSGTNWLGSGRRDRRSPSWAVAVDMARFPSVSQLWSETCDLSWVLDRVSVVRRRKRRECEAARQPHSSARCLVELVRADPTKGAAAP